MLVMDLIDLNPNQDIVVLYFSLEMVDYRNVGRVISNKTKKTVSELYSSVETLSDEDLLKAESAAETIKKYNIYFVDKVCNVEEIGNTIDYFHNTVANGRWLIVVLDHVLLVNGEGGERSTIVDLQKMFIQKKKQTADVYKRESLLQQIFPASVKLISAAVIRQSPITQAFLPLFNLTQPFANILDFPYQRLN